MDRTINKVPHDQCTGCGACYNKCPKDAITMEYDSEGFIFPQISDACVNCGLCEAVCPALNPVDLHDTPQSYAVWAEDEIRLQSSSGGMFTLLADYVLDNNGVVCGAAYTEDFQFVHHVWADSKEKLALLRGSKYVQSETELTYKEAKGYLDQGRMVLYTGCPCQIAGLYKYLGKDYDNLYTADLVCHGANSVTAYQSFIKEFSEGKEIEKVAFRDKKYYTWSTPTVIYLKDGNIKKAGWNESTWNTGFHDGVINRINCHSCPYAQEHRVSDITLADCWQVHRYNPSYDDRKGTSLVLVNTQKGDEIFKSVESQMKLCESVPLEFVKQFNGQLRGPASMHPSRKYFFSHLNELGYHKALWYGRGMRFDVGLVGWWFASNYGSSLTYYALGTILENMGKQVLMIPIAKKDGNPWEPEIKYTVDFLSQYFHIGNEREFDKMSEFNRFCDSFMLGSDQMWTGESTDLVGYTFFLDFVNRDKKKVAFSTSFGHSDFYASDEVCKTASDYLERFDAVSVREKSGVDICKNRFDIEAEQIIDPVFLCTAKEYDRILENVEEEIPKKYLLCYILDPTPEKEAAAKAIAEHENIEVVTILGLKEYSWTKDKWNTGTVLPRVTSNQFLYYIKNCSYLLTDSHHGTCFGIIYQKPYVALANANRGTTRFETVALAFGLMDRVFLDPLEVCHSEKIYEAIDYEQVGMRMEKETARAIRWLEDALLCPVKQSAETIRTNLVDCNRKVIGMSNYITKLEGQIELLNKQHEEVLDKLEYLSSVKADKIEEPDVEPAIVKETLLQKLRRVIK